MALTFFVKRRSRIVAKINSSLFFFSLVVSKAKLAVPFSTSALSSENTIVFAPELRAALYLPCLSCGCLQGSPRLCTKTRVSQAFIR